jgi:DNA topoisomerase-1
LRKEHVVVRRRSLMFEDDAKGGKHRVLTVIDPDAYDVVAALKRRRGVGAELLAYKDAGRWHDVTSTDINAHLQEMSGIDVTAKDFRTWHATVLMAVALGVSTHALNASSAAQTRAIARAYREVSDYLGNTPAICRRSYVDRSSSSCSSRA